MNFISIEHGNTVLSDSSTASFLTMQLNESVSITLVQQVVSVDFVKAIKTSKRISGWSAVAAGLNTLSAVSSEISSPRYVTHNYVRAVSNAKINAMESVNYARQAEDLKDLPVCVVIQNDSEREIAVNDMDNGYVWFVRGNTSLTIPVGNGMETHLRISDSNLTSNVSYITTFCSNEMDKFSNVAFENDDVWVCKEEHEVKSPTGLGYDIVIDAYKVIDKITMEQKRMTTDEGQEFIKELKKKK